MYHPDLLIEGATCAQRAERASKSLRGMSDHYEFDSIPSSLSDFMADVMHLFHGMGDDSPADSMRDVLRMAEDHFDAESDLDSHEGEEAATPAKEPLPSPFE